MRKLIQIAVIVVLASGVAGAEEVEQLFDLPIFYPIGDDPLDVCAADLDGNGYIDLVVQNRILLNYGAGDFQIGTLPVAGGTAVCAADLDGDGDTDIAVTGFESVGIVLNNGDGTFTNAGYYGVGTAPVSICAVDLGEPPGQAGDIDLVIANEQSGDIAILYGNGDGTFAEAESHPAGITARAVCTADFDGDGHQDCAIGVTREDYTHAVRLLHNNGIGRLVDGAEYEIEGTVCSVCAADFDADGDMDLAATSGDNGTVEILYNSGNGTFPGRVPYGVDGGPRSMCAADFNADGYPDLAVQSWIWGEISVFIGSSVGLFLDAVRYVVAAAPTAFCASDLNNDGMADLAVASGAGGVTVLLGYGDGTLQQAPLYETITGADKVCTSDFDLDGNPDIAVTGELSTAVSVLLGNGDATLQAQMTHDVGEQCTGLCTSDFDRDGIPDLALLADGLVLLIGNGDGTFLEGGTIDLGSGYSLCSGDFDGDGNPDVAAASWSPAGGVTVLLGNGNGTFQEPAYYPAGPLGPTFYYSYRVCTSDFDLDGDLDIVVSNSGTNNIAVFLGIGDGTFQESFCYELYAGGSPTDICLIDYFSSGYPDIAVAKQGYDMVEIILNLGDGTFYSGGYGFDPGSEGTTNMYPADIDGDGLEDLVMSQVENFTRIYYRTEGLGPRMIGGCRTSAICASDLDADGDRDLVVANCHNPGSVSVLENLKDPLTAVEELTAPRVARLSGNYPNPFNPSTTVRFGVPRPGRVRIAVYDIAGRRVAVLVDRFMEAGDFTARWDGRDEGSRAVASGVYFARMTMEGFGATRKMLLLR